MEIKFRAWDKKFINPATIVMRLDGHLFDRESGDELHSVEIIQFTGLHDKNKNESYYKDIIQDILTGAIYVIEYGKYQFRTGVGFGWYLSGIKVESRTFPTDLEDFRIVGNAFSNPELLK